MEGADQQFAGDRKGLAEGLFPPPPSRSCPRHLLSSHLFGERSTCQGNAGAPLDAGLDVLPRELMWTRGLRVAAIARYNFCNKWFPWVWMCLLGSCFWRLCCDFLLPSALSTVSRSRATQKQCLLQMAPLRASHLPWSLLHQTSASSLISLAGPKDHKTLLSLGAGPIILSLHRDSGMALLVPARSFLLTHKPESLSPAYGTGMISGAVFMKMCGDYNRSNNRPLAYPLNELRFFLEGGYKILLGKETLSRHYFQ